jgi:hypothetical protein
VSIPDELATISAATATIDKSVAAIAGELSPVVVTAIPVDDVIAGASISIVLQATGGTGAYTWTLQADAPAGVSLALGTNVIRGMIQAVGNYPFHVACSDGLNPTVIAPVEIDVAPAPSHLSPAVPKGTLIPGGAPVKAWKFAGLAKLPAEWAPSWFGSGNTQNGTLMLSSNVTMGPDGVNLALTASSGALISTNPNDGQHPGGTGYQVVPTAQQPVFVQFAGVNMTADTLKAWLAVWLDGQSWPADSEIDVMEAFAAWWAHLEFPDGKGGVSNPGQTGGSFVPGNHTFGVLWELGSAAIFYDGLSIGPPLLAPGYLNEPMYLIAENSKPSGSAATPSTFTISEIDVWQGALVPA